MSSGPTLYQLMFENDAPPDAALMLGEPSMAAVREQLSQVTAAGFADGVRDSLGDTLKTLLGISLGDVLGAAWGKARVLLEYCDEKKHPPSEVSLVPLSKHTIESKHKPYVDIMINGISKGRLELELRIAVTIESATLKVQNKQIWELRTGACKLEGTLKSGGVLLMEKKSKPVALPGTIAFENGIVIA